MEIFRKRPGTTNKGTEYENLNVANIVLNLVKNEGIKDFHISSNDENFGAFDDIVIEIESETNKEIYALQLKHSGKGHLTLEKLKLRKGDFSISKYFKSFKSLKIATTNIKFVISTNLRFNPDENVQFQLEEEDFYVGLSKCFSHDTFQILERNDHCYKFHVVENPVFENSQKIQDYRTFFDNFILYTNQDNVEKLKKGTSRTLHEMFCCDETESDKYFKMISTWTMKEGSKEKLNKRWMQRAIALQVLCSRIKPLAFGLVNENMKIFREAISTFDVSVFGGECYDKIKILWGDARDTLKYSIKEINEIRKKYQPDSEYVDDISNADEELLSKLLWLMGECPLLLAEDEVVYKAIQLCPGEKFIVVGNTLKHHWIKRESVFRDLSDLKLRPSMYKKLTSNFTCSIQGKEELTLEALMAKYQDLKRIVKTDNLLEMLDGPLLLGGATEVLPDPYVDRFLLKNIIDIMYLEEVEENTLIILYCVSNVDGLKRKLRKCNFIDADNLSKNHEKNRDNSNIDNLNNPNIYFSKNDYNPDYFRELSKIVKYEKNYHQFKYRDDGNLEWIQSKKVADLENYKLMKHYFVEEKELLYNSLYHNNVNLIIGDPGMGKTELLKNFKNRCFVKFWAIIIYPKDLFTIFQNSENNDANLFIEFILHKKYKNLSEIDRNFLKEALKNFGVIFIWDALDEISSKSLQRVLNVIEDLSKRNFLQILSSRYHLKKILETRFNVLSFGIREFSKEEQLSYIKKRFSDINSLKDADCKEITEKIVTSFAVVNTEILGIPLQIFMLTELFRQNTEKYVNLLNNSFSLTDLYSHFIEEKFNIYFKKSEMVANNPEAEIVRNLFKNKTLKYYEKLALMSVFSERILAQLTIDPKKVLIKFLQNNGSIGLITVIADQIPRFLHNSFAEYFVAAYFVKNLHLKDSILHLMFEKKYTNVRFFFDLMLAKHSAPHIAVLHKNYNFLKTSENEIQTYKDAGGRSVLHLACAWGPNYPHLSVQKYKKLYVVDDESDFSFTEEKSEYLHLLTNLVEKCKTFEHDTLFDLTPLEYAKKCNCLFAALKIIKEGKLNIKICDYSERANILYYAAKFGYEEAVDLFTPKSLPLIRIEKFKRTLLHFPISRNNFILKLLKTDKYRKEINTKDEIGLTPLFTACREGQEDLVNLLLEAGARLNLPCKTGATPLYTAVQNGHERVAKLLIAAGAAINLADNHNITPLYIATKYDHKSIIKLLIEAGAEINTARDSGATALHLAALCGYQEIVDILVTAKAEINIVDDDGRTPLFIAVSHNHNVIVELLCKAGASINLADSSGKTPLYIAARNNHEKIVGLLIAAGASAKIARDDGTYPLHAASLHAHEKIVELLVASGSEINLACNNGVTPLYIAAENGHEKIVELLIELGAAINLVRDNGVTPLHVASRHKHGKIVELLIKSGAEIDVGDDTGRTPLYVAVQYGCENIVELLIESGADVNRADKYGNTPVYIAFQNKYEKIVDVLTKSGAKMHISKKSVFDNFTSRFLKLS